MLRKKSVFSEPSHGYETCTSVKEVAKPSRRRLKGSDRFGSSKLPRLHNFFQQYKFIENVIKNVSALNNFHNTLSDIYILGNRELIDLLFLKYRCKCSSENSLKVHFYCFF